MAIDVKFERYFFGASFLLATVLPFADFRGVLFLVILAAFPAMVLLALVLIAAIVIAGILLVQAILGRKLMRALRYFGVILLIPIELYVGNWLSECATVLACAGELHSAINKAENGEKLPAPSQAFPIQVFQTVPEVASYAQISPLFLVEYVVYDAADGSVPDVATRLRADLDRNACEVSARSVISNYYWVSEAC